MFDSTFEAMKEPINELAMNFGLLLVIMFVCGLVAAALSNTLRVPDVLQKPVIGFSVLGGAYLWSQSFLSL